MRQTVRSHGTRETPDRGIAPRRRRKREVPAAVVVSAAVVVRVRGIVVPAAATIVHPRDRIPPPLHSQPRRHG